LAYPDGSLQKIQMAADYTAQVVESQPIPEEKLQGDVGSVGITLGPVTLKDILLKPQDIPHQQVKPLAEDGALRLQGALKDQHRPLNVAEGPAEARTSISIGPARIWHAIVNPVSEGERKATTNVEVSG
jgi:hypothetical protein